MTSIAVHVPTQASRVSTGSIAMRPSPLSSTSSNPLPERARKRRPLSTVSSVTVEVLKTRFFCDSAVRGSSRRASGRGGRRDRAHHAAQVAELVVAVESGDLVALAERRIVENRPDEILERAAQRHHRLSDVYELGG